MRSGYTWLGAAALGLALAPACATEEPGAIMVAVQTDLVAPKDVAAVGLYITSDGKPVFGDVRETAPNGEVRFPATIAVIGDKDRPSAVVRVRAIAFSKEGKVRILRDAITTVPRQRTALLRAPLRWINEGSGEGTRPDAVQTASLRTLDAFGSPPTIRSTCQNPDETFIDGACKDAHVDSEALPEYRAEDVFGGGSADGTGGQCFDVKACFASAQWLTLDDACTAPEEGEASLAIAVREQPGGPSASTGECLGNGVCLVPLDEASDYRVANGRVQLPATVCARIKKGEALGVVGSRACAPKTERIPSCGIASAVPSDHAITPDSGANSVFSFDAGTADATIRDASDATVPDAGSFDASDASFVDATLEAGSKDASSDVARPSGDASDDGGALDAAPDGPFADASSEGGPPDGSSDGGLGQVAVLRTGQLGAMSIAVNSNGVYWIAQNAFGPGLAALRGIDPEAPTVYLLDAIAPGPAPSATALAINGTSVLWTNSDGELLRCGLTGTNCSAPFQTAGAGTFPDARHIVADGTFVYVLGTSVRQCAITTGCGGTLSTLSSAPTLALVEDSLSQTAYFSEGSGLFSVKKCTNMGCNAGTIPTHYSTTASQVVDLAFGTTREGMGALSMLELDNDPPSVNIRWCPPSAACGAFVYTGPVTSIAGSDKAIYFTQGSGPLDKNDVWAIACSDNGSCGTPTLLANDTNITSMAAFGSFVYWSTADGRIMRAPRPPSL